MNDGRTLYRFELPNACFGADVQGGKIVSVAPIAKWALGKPVANLAAWVRRKGGTVLRLDGDEWKEVE